MTLEEYKQKMSELEVVYNSLISLPESERSVRFTEIKKAHDDIQDLVKEFTGRNY